MKASETLMEIMAGILGISNPGINDLPTLIQGSASRIIGDYPIFDEDYREVLNQKIISHYLNYQIGYESTALFYFHITKKMNEIMPYYNMLYDTIISPELIDYKQDVDYYEQLAQRGSRDGKVISADSSATNESHSLTDENTGWDVRSDNISSTSSSQGKETTSSSGEKTGNTANTSNERLEGNSNTISTNESTNESTSSSNGKKVVDRVERLWDKYSDTPQSGLDAVTGMTYITNLRLNDNKIDDSETTTNSGTGIDTLDGKGNSNTIDSSSKNTEGSANSEENTTSSGKKDSSSSGRDYRDEQGNSSYYKNQNMSDSRDVSVNSDGLKDEKVKDTLDYVKHIWGKRNVKDVITQILAVRDNIINIDMMIIEELHTLFFGLW